MRATDSTDDHFDPELNRYQVLGVIPARMLDRLWPGFAPQNYEVSINPVSVLRHMQKGPEYMQRSRVILSARARAARSLRTCHGICPRRQRQGR